MNKRTVDVAILGAGTAGLVAARQIARRTDNYVVIDDGPLGTTCARVGCMPSKALIQIAHDLHRRTSFGASGILGAAALSADAPAVLRRVRELRDRFTGAMIEKTLKLGDRLLRGRARFLEPTVLEVNGGIVRASRVIIATGSRPTVPDAWRRFGSRILTSDTLFEQENLPRSVAVFGLGVIGLELGQALHRLGSKVVGVARSQHLGGISDPAVLEEAGKILGDELTLWRGVKCELSEENGQLSVSDGDRRQPVDAVLAAMGRRPNVEDLGLENVGAVLGSDGLPEYEPDTLQLKGLPGIFIAGDANGAHPILHEAWDDGRTAGGNAVRENPVGTERRTPLHIVFSDPNIVAVGQMYKNLPEGSFVIGEINFGDQPRALIRSENAGLLRLYADSRSGLLLGSEMIAPAGEHLGHLLAWAIQARQTVHDLLRMPIYHPVLEEGLKEALQDAARKLPE